MRAERQTLLDYAIAEARAGRRARAAEVLWQIVADDPGNAQAWLWLSGVVAEPAEQRTALERVIALDPDNPPARRGLDWLREHHPELWSVSEHQATDQGRWLTDHDVVGAPETRDADPYAPVPAMLPPAPVDTPALARETMPAPAAAGQSDAQRGVFAPAQPDTAATEQMATPTTRVIGPGAGDEDNVTAHEELRCPDCGEWAAATDSRCPRCQTSLIVPQRPSAWARVARWTMALLWLLSAAGAILGSVALLRISQQLRSGGGSLALPVNPLLFGITPDALLRAVSGAGLTLGGIALIGVLMAIGLLARWRAVYVLHTLLALVALAAALALIFFTLPALSDLARLDMATAAALVGGVLGLPLVQTILALIARRDFFPRSERVRLPLETRSGEEHFRLGSRYQQRGWRWAAARELEQAAEQEPQVLKYRRALADVYASMGNHTRAREELRVSLNLQPDTSPSSRAGASAEDVQRGRE